MNSQDKPQVSPATVQDSIVFCVLLFFFLLLLLGVVLADVGGAYVAR